MRFPGFIGGSYQLRSITLDNQRCINLYADLDEMGTGKEGEVGSLLGTPGVSLLITLPTSPIRGVYTAVGNGRCFAVAGSVLYEIINTSGSYSYVNLGTLQTNTGVVSMADNGQQLCIVDGPNGYFYNFLETNENLFYVFTTSPVTASLNAIYSNNANAFTLLNDYAGATTVYASANGAPTDGATTLTLLTGNGDTTITASASSASSTVPWQAATEYVIGAMIVPVAGGYQYIATVGGISGSTIPSFPSTRYATVTDGTVTWERTSTFQQINDPGFLESNIVTYQDTYFFFAKPGTNQVYCSNSNATTFNALNFLDLGGSPAPVLNMVSLHRNLYIQTTKTTEVYYDAAISPGFPFARINGGYLEQGLLAQFSLCQTANAMFWLGQDKSGQGIVYTTSTFLPQRISTFAIEEAFEEYETLTDAIGYTYTESGHVFYVLNFPTAQATWCFDTSTNLWHERAYNNGGQLQMQLQAYHCFNFGINLVGDYTSGNIYEMSQDIYSDNGTVIIRKRVAPHIAQDMLRIFYSSFQLDIQQGDGLDGNQQGSNPQCLLRFSDDGGRTWSNIKDASIGKIGETKKRVIFRRLGQARDRVFEITISDPIFVSLVGAELYLEQGAS